ncbi:Prolyl tripeptidyl peptidase precursor [Streptomyces sp. YIM 121038]|uniref:alpha/beta hydrolase family protein n=1 Tax=Streptomyces sp. YIM 121038 TaxID=2136401 RepID=UPI0011656A16|nr:alpha/beta fold hydrolase [Streptomyces sp. YIM 121038]QCX81713.1 Prolyl tripeptidyl peptidase precursor [Streptomyces sp. YIM 121038]
MSRFQVYRAALPEVCAADPRRMVFTADADGRCEVFTWDAAARRARQVTDRPGGTLHGAIDRDARVWWFAEDARGVGHWRFQPFTGGPDRPGLAGVPDGTARGLAVTGGAIAAVGIGLDDGTAVHIGSRGGPGREVTRVDGPAALAGLTPAGDLLVLTRGADSPHAVTVLTPEGDAAAVLPGDGAHGRLWALGFAPAGPDATLLLVRERDDRYLLETWTPATGTVTHDWCAFDTQITARWYPEGRSVLIRQDRHGRSLLHRADLERRALDAVPAPPGTLLDAAPHPGGDLHTLWTDTAHPPRMAATAGTPLPPLGTVEGRVPGTLRDIRTPGPDGPVHTLLSLPEDGPGPYPAVFLVHGGPADHDRDAYDGTVHSLVASGFAVARVNYRGSTGYGPRWQRAFGDGVGHTQVADLTAVRADLVARGLIRPDATGLWGTSWGGYLVLLALGTRPGLWRAGVAVKPVADYAAAHASATPALRALDERLFGGTPEQVPARYAHSSPIRYAVDVQDPLLVVAATHDTKCPAAQVRSYLGVLHAVGARHESLWLDSGHDGYDGGDHVAVLRRAVLFLDRELRGTTPPRRPPPPGRGSAHRTAHQ